LVGTGAERSLAVAVGQTFSWKARGPGKIARIDERQQIAEVQYDDGTTAVIDLSPRSAKNSGSGFYITAQLRLMPGLKVGSRIEAGQIVAHDPGFFAPSGDGGLTYKGGVLARVALTALDQTYEDSVMVTRKLAEQTAATVTILRTVSLGPRANLQTVAKVGDVVSPNTALAVFENVSDDADVAALLDRVGSEFDEAIGELAKNTAVAKYSGRVIEVRVLYNRDPSELSPSLQAYLKKAERAAAERDKVLGGAPGARSGAPERIHRDKVDGEIVDGVLLEFFIAVEVDTGPGDKMTLGGSALKGVVSRVLEEGEEPISEDGHQVDYLVSPLSVISRMTLDFFLNCWTNAVLVDTKQRILELYEE